MIQYICDKCGRIIPKGEQNILQTLDFNNKKVTKHFCKACFVEFRYSYNAFLFSGNTTEKDDTKISTKEEKKEPKKSKNTKKTQTEKQEVPKIQINVDERKDYNICSMVKVYKGGRRLDNTGLMRAMIYIFKNDIPMRYIWKKTGVSTSALNNYKQTYSSPEGRTRTCNPDRYVIDLIKSMDYGKMLSMFANGNTDEDILHEFISHDLTLDQLHAIICFLLNILNTDWFDSELEVINILYEVSTDMAKELEENHNRAVKLAESQNSEND